MTVELTRELRLKVPVMHGSDVMAAKRMTYKQLAAAGLSGQWWTYYVKMNAKARSRFGPRFKRHLKQAQAQLGVPQDGVFGEKTLDAMVKKGRVDAVVEQLLAAAMPTPEEKAFDKLIRQCEEATRLTPGYLLGGGHGIDLDSVSYTQKLDCSSSSSKVLHESGMYDHEPNAIVSGLFARYYGEAGTGAQFTVYGNDEHVWIRLNSKRSKYWRFDTSPHGDGGRGPRLRRLPRFSSSFNSRHWKGM